MTHLRFFRVASTAICSLPPEAELVSLWADSSAPVCHSLFLARLPGHTLRGLLIVFYPQTPHAPIDTKYMSPAVIASAHYIDISQRCQETNLRSDSNSLTRVSISLFSLPQTPLPLPSHTLLLMPSIARTNSWRMTQSVTTQHPLDATSLFPYLRIYCTRCHHYLDIL